MLNLVIQSTQDIATPHLKAIAKLVNTTVLSRLPSRRFAWWMSRKTVLQLLLIVMNTNWTGAFVQAGMKLSDIGFSGDGYGFHADYDRMY